MAQPLRKTAWVFLERLNIELPYDPVMVHTDVQRVVFVTAKK